MTPLDRIAASFDFETDATLRRMHYRLADAMDDFRRDAGKAIRRAMNAAASDDRKQELTGEDE